jgi:hypothetical protein
MTSISTDVSAVTEERKPAGERRWRRRSLFALIVLLPVAYAEMSYRSLTELLTAEDLVAREVPWGTSVSFGGSEWRLEDLRAALGMEEVPPDATAVLADFTVKVGNPDLQKLWLGCRIGLVDAAGRQWSPRSVDGLRLPAGVMGCNSAIFSGAKPGDVLEVSETFLVPRDATATIRATVGLGSERPWYLRFERPPS